MKVNGLNVLAAFLGGAAVGAACGVLFAPEKGTDTRNRIAEVIRKRGIKLNSKDMESLVDDIADELQPATIDVIQLKSQGKRYPHYVVALSLTLFLLHICFLLTKI